MNNGNKLKKNESILSRENLQKFGTVTTAAAMLGAFLGLNKAVNKDVGQRVEEFEKNVEVMEIDSAIFRGGPKVRSNPEILSGEEGNNVILDLGNSDQKIVLSEYNDSVYVYDPRDDANGEWVGFSAEKFADALYESSYIDEKTKNKIIESDQGEQRDGIVWVNGHYVELQESETPGEVVNQQN